VIIFLESFAGYDETTLVDTGGNFDNWFTDGGGEIAINDQYGRSDSNGLQLITNSRTINSRASATVRFGADYSRLVVGFAVKITSQNGSTTFHDLQWITPKVLCTFYYRDTPQCSLVITPSMRLALVKATLGLEIARSSYFLKENVYYYLEADVSFANSVGAIVARIDGKERLNTSAIDTDEANSGLCDGVRFGIREQTGEAAAARWVRVSHIYIAEKTIPADQGFVGDLHIEGLRPVVDRLIQWTPSAGTNSWDLVNDLNPDKLSTYSAADAAGQLNLYGLESSVVTSGSVMAIGSNYFTQKSKAEIVGVRSRFIVGGTDMIGDSHYLQQSWSYRLDIAQRTSQPSSYLPIGAIAGGSFGVERVF
jgi:hypothetical protein